MFTITHSKDIVRIMLRGQPSESDLEKIREQLDEVIGYSDRGKVNVKAQTIDDKENCRGFVLERLIPDMKSRGMKSVEFID